MPLIGGIAALAGKRVAVFGAGTEGRSFADLVEASCAELIVVDDAYAGAGAGAGAGADALGLEVRPVAALEEVALDFVVRSPGVSRYDDRLAAAASRGAVVTTPTTLWLEDFSDRQVVAVTGSKGKSTTAVLTAAALGAYGLDVALAGNIGRPLTELYRDAGHDVFVVELSSYQTADVTVSPTVGVLTLLAPDHLVWHRDTARYYRDKLHLFAHRSDLPVAVNGTCSEAVRHTAGLRGRVLYGKGGAVRLERGQVVVGEQGPLELTGFQLLGEHNLVNACGAITAAILLTRAPPELGALGHALEAVEVPRSRLEPIGVFDGVSYVDDALASNPEGTVAALAAFAGRQVSVIVGGQDRGLDYEPLALVIASFGDRVSVVCLGDAGAAIARALRSMRPTTRLLESASLEQAVEAAVGLARSAVDGRDRAGGPDEPPVVLFSPGAPTPTAEGSYLDRSRRFRHMAGATAHAHDREPA